jgi:4-hydroxybenzoate polyprenyltransferase
VLLNTAQFKQKWPHLVILTRINRPIGILLLLWPTLWALWLAADGLPDLKVLLIFILGTILTRSAGCAINDYADRHWDGQVDRTENRPLATQALTPTDALVTTAVLMLLAFVLVLLTNTYTIQLSFVALFLAVLYPFTKRITQWPQLFLGLAFAWAVPMAFAAQTGTTPSTAWIVFLAAVVWALAYDTLYAIVDRSDDIKVGIKSTAILFGRYDLWLVGVAQTGMLCLMLIAGDSHGRGFVFFIGLAAAALLIAKQLHDCRHRDPKACFQAFLNNHYVGMLIFTGLFLDYLIFPATTA